MRSLLIVAALACSPAFAEPAVMVAEGVGGSQLRIYDEAGDCQADARRAEWVSPDGKTRIRGCWKASRQAPGLLQMTFADADAAMVPIEAFKAPGTL